MAARGERPNFLVIVTDDQRWDALGCAGNRIIRTPNMDRLAREGAHFVNAFVTSPICAASRASIFIGLYERTHRFNFRTPPLKMRFVEASYPALLRKFGYFTGFVGKFGVEVEKGGVGRMFDFFKPLFRNPYFKRLPDGTVKHLTDITADIAISFLRSCRKEGNLPFCLSVSFNAPHAEDKDPRQYIWPEAMDGLYRNVTIPVPKTAEPAFFERLPDFLKESLNRVRWHWRFDTPEKFQRMVKGYYRMISGVDAALGRIMAELERLGLAGSTVVIFTSDNGYFLGERGFAGKWLLYEPSIRVPLIVLDPQSPLRGTKLKEMALNVDIAPTILELAGLEVPKTMQGMSLAPLLRGRSVKWRKDFFVEHLFEHPKIPKSEGVRTERWKYIRYFEQRPVYEELYDLATDRFEERNLAGDPRFSAVLNALRRRCDELRDLYGGPYVPLSRGIDGPLFAT